MAEDDLYFDFSDQDDNSDFTLDTQIMSKETESADEYLQLFTRTGMSKRNLAHY
jgi:hypothetical protein